MRRSNPNEGRDPNPSTRWFEWNGENGVVRYYDKDAKTNVDVPLPFSFLLLDQLGTVRGWHEPSQSGIYANEVKDTRQERLLVKSFKGGIIAEGVYKDIKLEVNASGGQFNANCYVAFKNGGGELSIGALRFKGAALSAWMEFSKTHRAKLYEDAVVITGFTEGKKGRITYRVPTFTLKAVSQSSQQAAVGLDAQLQAFLDGYFKRTTSERVDRPQTTQAHDEPPPPDDNYYEPSSDVTEDDIPF
jgi:hypothetical protein